MLASFAPDLVRVIAALSALALCQGLSAAAADNALPRSPYTATTSAIIPLTRRKIDFNSVPSGFAYHPRLHPRNGKGQAIGWDSGLDIYTVDAQIGKASYHMILSFGTPNVILAKSSGYKGGEKTGKTLSETYGPADNHAYKVDIFIDTVALSGMKAPGVGVGLAHGEEPIQDGASSKPVGILGLGPENEDSYVESDKRFGTLVTASGPTPFAIKLGEKTGTLQFGQFSPRVWAPLSKTGTAWDVQGSMNGVSFEQGTFDPQDTRLAMPDADAEKLLRIMGLTPELVQTDGGTVTSGKVDCNKGAPLTFKGPDGKGEVTLTGPGSVWRVNGSCYSIVYGYGKGNGETFWILPQQWFFDGVVFDIRKRMVGVGGVL